MDGAWNLARRGVRAASGLQRACIAVELAGAIEQRVVFRHANSWRDEWATVLSQLLSGRADIGVAFLVIGEVNAREGPVGALRLVEHRDVRLDPTLFDQPGEHLGRTIAGVGRQTRRGDLEPVGGALD